MSESQPTAPESTITTTKSTTSKKQKLPSIITVENSAHTKATASKDGHRHETSQEDGEAEGTFGQARTPKHANKTDPPRHANDRKDNKPQNLNRHFKSTSQADSRYLEQPSSEQQHSQQQPQQQHPIDRSSFGFAPPPPPRPYEGRAFGESSAFHMHDTRQSSSRMDYYGPPPPMQVSPGRGAGGDYRYYEPQPPRGDYHPRYPAQPVPRFSEHSRGGYPPEGYHGSQPPPPRYDPSFIPRGPPPPPPPPHQYGAYPPPPPPPPGAYNSGANGPPPPFHERYGPPPLPQYGHHGRPPTYPDHPRERPTTNTLEGRYGPPEPHVGGANNNNTTFSRAVSSSFDRSVKSRSSDGEIMKQEAAPMDASSPALAPHHPGYLPDDSSWRQLNQVTSVDEAVLRDRLDDEPKTRATPPTPADEDEGHRHQLHHHHRNSSPSPHPRSNSSSLTNSPAENHHPHVEDGAPSHHTSPSKPPPPIPTPSKLASLDSLSSVASAQEPIEEPKKKALPPTSPGSSAASIDLMKCSSGSAGLLNLPHHGRDASLESLPSYRLERKRSREDRGDMDTTTKTSGDDDEIRRAPSDYEMKEGEANDETPPSKRGRRGDGKTRAKKVDPKSSPLPSPTQSPVGEKQQHPVIVQRQPSFGASRPPQPQPLYASRSTSHDGYIGNAPAGGGNAYFDKGPSYTYSMDSATSFPRESHHRHSYPPRPASSSSSTITPMGGGPVQLDGHLTHEASHREGIGQSLPSWDIQAQDSFGAASTGGGPLMSTFSFSQDYPMLSNSGSNLGYTGEHGGPVPVPPHHHRRESYPPLESRNQSFEGGHYHGSFSRTESMDVSYGGGPRHGEPPPPPYMNSYNKQPPPGPFPPHAPSWGTASSSGSGPSHHGHPGGGPPPPPHMQQLIQYHRGPPHPSFGPGPMMRSFSEDNSGRASPPPGPPPPPPPPPPPHRMLPGNRPGFQPPPEFAAPQNPHLNRRPPPAVYIMSTSASGSNQSMNKRGPGVFSWSKEDDMRLTDIMKKYKNPRDWEPIAKEHARGKTAKECHERWIRYLKPGVRKGQWTDHEDAIVIEAVTTSTEQPFTRWSDLAQRLPGRVGKQIRDRWVNHLNPNINHLPFSREDDLLLWDGHKKVGKRWVEISTKFFNSTRSENHIKNRWYSASFKKFICNEFGPEAYSGGKGKGEDKKGKKSTNVDDDADSTIEAV